MTASPRMIKRCWIKAGLLAQENEEGEVELRIDHQVDEEVLLLREIRKNNDNGRGHVEFGSKSNRGTRE